MTWGITVERQDAVCTGVRQQRLDLEERVHSRWTAPRVRGWCSPGRRTTAYGRWLLDGVTGLPPPWIGRCAQGLRLACNRRPDCDHAARGGVRWSKSAYRLTPLRSRWVPPSPLASSSLLGGSASWRSSWPRQGTTYLRLRGGSVSSSDDREVGTDRGHRMLTRHRAGSRPPRSESSTSIGRRLVFS